MAFGAVAPDQPDPLEVFALSTPPHPETVWRRSLRAHAGLPQLLREIPSLRRQSRELCNAIAHLVRQVRRGEWPPQRERNGPCCFDVPDVYVRADPLLYAQYYLMARGLAVTWDNPDIEILDGGVPVAASALQPDREYEVRVRVWNGSYDAPALGMGVSLSFLTFGIATISTAVGMTEINLGAKGTAQHPAVAKFLWRTPRTPGHYCLQAQLHWHDDANPDNNLGQDNVYVGALSSPATFRFPLRNDASVTRRFVLGADTYQLPAPRPCEEAIDVRRGERMTRLAESRARWEEALRQHRYEDFGIPEDWRVDIEPREFSLRAGQEQDIAVSIEPVDAGFRGRKPFNVHAFSVGPEGERHLVGGVTLVAER